MYLFPTLSFGTTISFGTMNDVDDVDEHDVMEHCDRRTSSVGSSPTETASSSRLILRINTLTIVSRRHTRNSKSLRIEQFFISVSIKTIFSRIT